MANININGTLFPAVSGEATHDSATGRGGYRTVVTDADRIGLLPDYKSDGTLVFVRDTYVTWQWNQGLGIWEEYPNNISGSQIANGSITEVKMDDDSVSTRTIQNSAVETAQIDDGAVALAKLNTDVTDNYYDKSTADVTFLPAFTTVPSSDSDGGEYNNMAKDNTFLYVCLSGESTPGTAGNWGRVALDTSFPT